MNAFSNVFDGRRTYVVRYKSTLLNPIRSYAIFHKDGLYRLNKKTKSVERSEFPGDELNKLRKNGKVLLKEIPSNDDFKTHLRKGLWKS